MVLAGKTMTLFWIGLSVVFALYFAPLHSDAKGAPYAATGLKVTRPRSPAC
jgi:hypothetical protein